MFRKIAAVIIIALVLVFGIVSNYLFKSRSIPNDYVLQIPAGSSLTYVARQLSQAKVINNKSKFINLLEYLYLERNIIAGDYRIELTDNLYSIIKKITQGDIINHRLVIYEGMTTKDIKQTMAKNKHIYKTDFLEIKSYNEIAGVKLTNMEGIFYPDTYYHTNDTADEVIYEKAYAKMQSILLSSWNTRQDNLPYTDPYQALIMASIIEKETHILQEKPLVAAVFVNRLRKSMRLQADPTIVYGLGDKYKGFITKKNLSKDSVYNTYTRRGLPPTPICNPSRTSIDAALNPSKQGYLYFVLNIHGEHVFSNTLAEHVLAVQEYRKHKKWHKKLLYFLQKIAEI